MILNNTIERGLILLSSMGLFCFLFPELIYLKQFYTSFLVLTYVISFFILKIKFRLSLDIILLLIISFFILSQICVKGEFGIKRMEYYMLMCFIICFQFNKLLFIRHNNFAIKAILISIVVFNLTFVLKLLLSNLNFIYNVEQHFDNVGIYAIFVSLSTIILATHYNIFNFQYIKYIVLIYYIITVYYILILESRTAFIILISYVILQFIAKLRLSKRSSNIVGFVCIPIIIIVMSLNFKSDSSSGRFFILRTTSYIIKDHPLTGIGFNNFPIVYPTYQAAMYTEDKMYGKEKYLADNVKVAFNEYIHITAELGIVGLIILLLIITIYFHYARNSYAKNMLLCMYISMSLSYVLHSPIIVWVSILSLSLIEIPMKTKASKVLDIFLLSSISVYIGYNVMFISKKLKCNNIANILCIQSPQSINNFYNKNREYLCDNYKILFTIAEINYKTNHIDKAIIALEQLSKLIIRNDIELLRAKCYIEQGKYNLAEHHLKLSIAICPNRFINRYELFKLYKIWGKDNYALEIAKDIYYLEEKIVSSHTVAIKREIEEYLLNKTILL